MTNAHKLRQLKEEHGLVNADIAQLLGVSIYTVRSWLRQSQSEAYRPMGDRELEFLNLKLKEDE